MRIQKNKIKKYMLPLIGIITGIVILLLPVIENAEKERKNKETFSSMAAEYNNYAENGEEIERQLRQADLYNKKLACEYDGDDVRPYNEQLTFDGNGVMGYVEIPKINVKMLIYHGTSDEALAMGAGHVESSSLPVGGESSHSVITAHSGLRSMKAFDDLKRMEIGDCFYVSVLGKTLEYIVDSIETVLPFETESLQIYKGQDRCTLVTCTPYGINDHRLLVHGLRTK